MLDVTHLESFCGGQQFWDFNLTWNTTDPDFTECFQKTVLSWLPSVVLGLLSPIELYFLHKSRGYIPWTILNVTKMVMCSVLLFLTMIQLGSVLALSESLLAIAPVEVFTPSIKIVSYALALMFSVLEKKRGLHTSGVQWAFWLLSAVTGAVIYRSFLIRASDVYVEVAEIDFVMEAITYPLVLLQFVLSCLSDADPIHKDTSAQEEPEDHCDNLRPCPEMSASFPSQLFFSWFDRMAIKGFRTDLETTDLWRLNPRDRSRTVFPVFDKFWEREVDRISKRPLMTAVPNVDKGIFPQLVPPSTAAESSTESSAKKPQPSVMKVLFQSFGWLYVFGTFLKLTSDLFLFINPLILDLLINFAASDLPLWRGFLYAGVMLVVAITNLVLIGQSSHIAYWTGMRIRSALISAIYRKALKLSSGTKRNYTLGEIVNLMAVDVQRMVDATVLFNIAWTTPIQFSIALYLLWQRLGPSVLAGIAVLVTLILLTISSSGYAKKLQAQQMKLKDHRLKLMNEILNGMKVLKLYAWETCFMNLVNGIRSDEIKVLRKAAYFGTGMTFVWMSSSVLIASMTFTTYVLVDSNNILDANKAFVSLSLFGVMQAPIMLMPMAIMAMIQATIALKRIKKFLMSEELNLDNVQHVCDENYAIKVENASFMWSLQEPPVLDDLSLKVPVGSLVAVVGPVGAGKSSLVSAILGEMEKVKGRVTIADSIAYVSQQAWMQNATIKENILFGKRYRSAFYDRVIEACALRPDLQILPAGDQTEIGEKGINLSGGQKQRISLARAVYHEANIYLLDDPLSAVDVHVGTHIFNNLIGPKGLLKDKTRVLVTHRISYLPQVDLIVVINEGHISEVGTYRELLDRKGLFAEFLINYVVSSEDEETEGVEEIREIITKMGSSEHEKILARSMSLTESENGLKSLSIQTSFEKSMKRQFSHSSSQPDRDNAMDSRKGVLTVVETAETGKVKWDTYFHYAKSISGRVVFFTLLCYVFAYSCSMGSSVWLSIWSNDKPGEDGTLDTALRDLRLGVYGGLGITFAILILFGGLFITYGTMKAAEKLHHEMLHNVLRSPMSFFDTTPLGRIVNRFSKDVDVVDLVIPQILQLWMGTLFQVLAVIVVISIGTPLFLAAAVPNFILYYFLQKFYVTTSRQLKRLESVTRSPIYSHFSESVAGAATIRAFGRQQHFIAQSETKVDKNHECYYPSIISNRWIGIRLELIGNVLVFCAAMLVVLGRGTLSPGVVGLIISYALSITVLLNWVVRMTSDLETNIVAIERIKEYTSTPTEAEWEIPDKKPPEGWPSHGEITFDRYCTRYRKGLDLVLQKITCNINSGEKVGIVGRTGAGKSSLTQALFRIIEAADGSIKIDGEEISKLGLHDLRSRLTIIPQDPVLFSASLRMNLDPFNSHSDDEIWKALELSHLKSFVASLPESLSYQVSEGGENLSVGQRQLVCLTRAVLRKTKILVLDEATAAVDLETDDLIQATIRKEFAECTVLTIAHRLNTIMDNDRILVLDLGRIKEFDSPSNLLRNKSSIFYSMAKDAGLAP